MRRMGRLRQKDPFSAEWFGNFDQGESTFTEDGVDAGIRVTDGIERLAKTGRDMSPSDDFIHSEVQTKEFFHESPSGGAQAAWDTHYPSLGHDAGGAGQYADHKWKSTPEGWVEEYIPSPETFKSPKPAKWFDNSVHQLGAYGRNPLPDMNSPQRLMEDFPAWTERAVNTTITCADVGCTANTTVKPYDVSTEEGQHCMLSVDLHPTDFDDDHGGESAKHWLVNGFLVTDRCRPISRVCNESGWRPLYPCLNGVDITHLINTSTGEVIVSGSLSTMVDECPYEGNLLSGVVVVTCMVREKTTTTTTPSPALLGQQEILAKGVLVGVPLQCAQPGCVAKTLLEVNPQAALMGSKCTMNVTLNQTDFDDAVGSVETVEYVKFDGSESNLTTNAAPGKNPCKAACNGAPLKEAEKSFTLLPDTDVTEQLLAYPQGSMRLEGKLSQHVDECETPAGYLLDAWVTVYCPPPSAPGNSTSSGSSSTAAAPAPAPAI